MAEIVGSVVTVLDLLGKAKAIYSYVKDVRSADETRRKFAVQIEVVIEQLEWVQDHCEQAQSGDFGQRQFLKLFTKGAPDPFDGRELWIKGSILQQLEKLLFDLDSRLRPLEHERSTPSKQKLARPVIMPGLDSKGRTARSRSPVAFVRRILYRASGTKLARQLQFPFQEADLRKNLQDLRNLSSGLDSITGRVAVDAQQHNRLLEETRQASQWLSPWAPQDMDSGSTDPFGTIPIDSDWLLSSEEFLVWKYGRPWNLYIYGDPGSGKTVLAKQIIRHLQEAYSHDPAVGILYLALKFDRQGEQNINSLWRSLLTQAMAHPRAAKSRDGVRKLWLDLCEATTRPDYLKTGPLLTEALKELNRAFIIVDGIDETTDDIRKALQDGLQDIASEINDASDVGKVSLLFTSRPLDVGWEPYGVDCSAMPGGKRCSQRGRKVFYKCRNTHDHGPDFYLCRSCASSGKFCSNVSPHHLEQEPRGGGRIDIRLSPPDSSIEALITALIDREMNIGVHSEKAGSRRIAPRSDQTTVLGRLLDSNPSKREEIVNTIRDNARGLFMLAQMQWQHVRESTSFTRIDLALRTLPKELDESFEETLKRIKSRSVPVDQQEQGMKVVIWVSQTRRLLTLDDLQVAMSVEQDEEGLDALAIIGFTKGLVMVDSDSCVRLVHRTAYEYLSKPQVKESWFPDAQDYITKTCLKTLLDDTLMNPVNATDGPEGEAVSRRLQKLPFVSYAAQHWGFHANSCQSSPGVSEQILTMLTKNEHLASAVQISAYYEEVSPTGWTSRHTGVNALHVAAWFGLESTFDTLISRGLLVSGCDSTINARTPLLYACRGGRFEAVQKLIELGADVNERDGKRHYPPLLHAIMTDEIAPLEALCQCDDLDINATIVSGRTALMQAADRGLHKAIPLLLVRKDLDVNLGDEPNGMTALMLASRHDSVATVEALLSSNRIDVNQTNRLKATALHYAALEGQADIVRLLLKHGADPDAKDSQGGTPIRRAADNKHLAVIKQFISDPSWSPVGTEDSFGKSLLFSAAIKSGRLLQELITFGFDVNAQANDGCTPLHDAAADSNLTPSEKSEIVQILLGAGADRTLLDSMGRSAADLAYEQGHFDVGDLITPSAEAATARHDVGKLPATSLARNGLIEELEKRLEQAPHDLLVTSGDGETPLAAAIYTRNYNCVPVILEAYSKEQQGIDVSNVRNRSPLHEAAGSGRIDLVRLLLAHKPKLTLNMVDDIGTTPLSEAINSGCEESVIALMEAGASLREQDEATVEMLTAAVEADNLVVAQALIYAGARIINAHRKLAREHQNADMIRLVEKHKTSLKLGPASVESELVDSSSRPESKELVLINLPAVPKHDPTKPMFTPRIAELPLSV